MKRSLQEIVELVVFGLIALLLGTAVLWLLGWVFGLLGTVLLWFAGLIWALLRFIVPVAIVAAIVYFVVRLVQQGRDDRAETSTYAPAPTAHADADEAAAGAATGAPTPPAGTPPAEAPSAEAPPADGPPIEPAPEAPRERPPAAGGDADTTSGEGHAPGGEGPDRDA